MGQCKHHQEALQSLIYFSLCPQEREYHNGSETVINNKAYKAQPLGGGAVDSNDRHYLDFYTIAHD